MFILNTPVLVNIHIHDGQINECIKSFSMNSQHDIDNLEVMTYAMQLSNSELFKDGTISYTVDSVHFKEDEPEEGFADEITFTSFSMLRTWYLIHHKKEYSKEVQKWAQNMASNFAEELT